MVTQSGRPRALPPNDLQDVELPRVPRPNTELIPDASGDSYINTRAVRFHYDHLSSGLPKTSGCTVCREGLEGVMALVKTPRPEPRPDEVAPHNGGDPEDDPALSSGGWTYTPPDGG